MKEQRSALLITVAIIELDLICTHGNQKRVARCRELCIRHLAQSKMSPSRHSAQRSFTDLMPLTGLESSEWFAIGRHAAKVP